MATPNRELEEVLTPALAAVGYDLEALEISPAGKRRLVRVAIDKDGGVTLDDVAEATKVIDDLLDTSDALGEQPFTLEVTSRGVDRPLSLPRHWRRNATRLVKATLSDGSTVKGRIVTASDDAATLDVDGAHHTLPYAEVTKALVEIEFNRTAGPAIEED